MQSNFEMKNVVESDTWIFVLELFCFACIEFHVIFVLYALFGWMARTDDALYSYLLKMMIEFLRHPSYGHWSILFFIPVE